MSPKTLSAITLAIALIVGIGFNTNAWAKPPKESKTVVKTVKKKVPPEQMSTMDKILKANTNSLESMHAILMAGTGTEFVMGSGSKGMGFSGTGSGGDGGFARIHGLGQKKPPETKLIKKRTKKSVHKEGETGQPQLPNCSCPSSPAYEEPAMTPLK